MDTTALEELREAIASRREEAMLASVVENGELTVRVAAAAIPDFIDHLKTDPSSRFTGRRGRSGSMWSIICCRCT